MWSRGAILDSLVASIHKSLSSLSINPIIFEGFSSNLNVHHNKAMCRIFDAHEPAQSQGHTSRSRTLVGVVLVLSIISYLCAFQNNFLKWLINLIEWGNATLKQISMYFSFFISITRWIYRFTNLLINVYKYYCFSWIIKE